MHELLVELFDQFRVIYDNFRYEAACLKIASSLKFEEISLRHNNRFIVPQTIKQT